MSEVHGRFCVHCRNPIPETRLRRGKITCSTECKKADRISRRTYLAAFKCRLCGRPRRDTKGTKLDPVRSAHTLAGGSEA